MTKTYILDRGVGYVQHVSDKTDHMEALREFHAEVGIDPHGTGLRLEDWVFVDADEALAAKIDAWMEQGYPAAECPEELANYI